MKIVALVLGALFVLKWIGGVGRPWALVGVFGDAFVISVPKGARNGLKYCLLGLCYFPALRAEISKRFAEAGTTLLLDRVTLHAIAQLDAGIDNGSFARDPELRDMLAESSTQPAAVEPHSYQIEYYHTLLTGSGTINMIPAEVPLSSLVFHYLELLRAISNAVSAKNRRILLQSLRTLIVDQQALPPMNPFRAVGVGLVRANKLFLTAWRAARDRDLDFDTAHLSVIPASRLRRAGHAIGRLLAFLSFTTYWLLPYVTDRPLVDVAALAAVLHSVGWILGGLLQAQAAALLAHLPRGARSMMANALWRRGRHCRFVATAALVLMLVAAWLFTDFVNKWDSAFLPGILAALGIGFLSEMAGWFMYCSAIERAWAEQQGTSETRSVHRISSGKSNISVLSLYFTLPLFSVLVPYTIVVALLRPLTERINAVSVLLGAVILSLAEPAVRFGAPKLFKSYLAGRTELPKVTLLRKFFVDEQSRMLRKVVSPSLGAYATVMTLFDPSYAEGRKHAPSIEQEDAESVLDVLANASNAIRTPDELWKDAVQKSLDQSDFVVIDVTVMSGSIAWELAECLKRFHPNRILLVCYLIGEAKDRLQLARIIQASLSAEVQVRREPAREIEQRFREVAPPLVYAPFPDSLLFKLALVRRLKRCLSAPTRPGEFGASGAT